MKTLTKKEKTALDEFGSRLAKKLNAPFEMYLYGSKARGEAHRYSDVDVLVIVVADNRQIKDKVAEISFDVMIDFDIELSSLTMLKKEWDKLKEKPTSFSYTVMQDAVKL